MTKNTHTILEFLATLYKHQTKGCISFEALGDRREMFRHARGQMDQFEKWLDQRGAAGDGIYFRQARLNLRA